MKTKRTPTRAKSRVRTTTGSGPKAERDKRKKTFRVVGLGISAGGLEASELFFTHLRPDTGMAFVVISHLDPDHKGIMPELLQHYTSMKVTQAEDKMKVRPNRVYVIPPNADLSILHGVLYLLEPVLPRGLRTPIDFFFKQLAQDQKDRAIGIVLSGMGTDGAEGLRAIKAELGLTMAQDPSSAKYESMPRSSIMTGSVDIVSPAADLPVKLEAYVKHIELAPRLAIPRTEEPTSAMQRVFVLLRARTGADFSAYKTTTVHRRIERRMSVHQMHSLPHYVRFLQENPQEVDLLYRELLIGVTNFFRDPGAFVSLKEKVIPRVLQNRAHGTPLRVWIPGCSTGEEAYSVAIILTEALERRRRGGTIQIFATDLDKEAIDTARQGFFPLTVASNISQDRLRRFFTKEDHGYFIRKEVRDKIVFAQHDLLFAPPFTKLDLLCCRNLLIYLNSDWQKKVLTLMHYALNPAGFLFLGTAETVSGMPDLFTTVDNRWKIFQKKEPPMEMQVFAEMAGPHQNSEPIKIKQRENPTPAAASDLAETAQRMLTDLYLPPSVVVSSSGDIVYIVGHTGKYLEPSSGKVNLNLFAMAREELRDSLHQAVTSAVRHGQTVLITKLKVRTNKHEDVINVSVRPISKKVGKVELLLVTFEDAFTEPTPGKGKKKPAGSGRAGRHVRNLEKALENTQMQLQTTIEEMRATEEELKAANEELQSNNEELQSTNEELMTSKEELQSLNEEMTTVNAELQIKLDEQTLGKSDVTNMMNAVDVATILTDNELRIVRFTPQATRLVNLIPADVGRPLGHIATNLKYDRLVEHARGVLSTLVPREVHVQSTDGRWNLMRILPYRTQENLVEGVVITFTDITPLMKLEASLSESQQARLLAESIIRTVREPLLVLDAELRIVSANRAFAQIFQLPADVVQDQLLEEVDNRQWDVPELKKLLMQILPGRTEITDFRIEHDFPRVGHKVFVLNARQLHRLEERAPLILLAIQDETEKEGE